MPKGRSGIITEEFKGKENTAYTELNWSIRMRFFGYPLPS